MKFLLKTWTTLLKVTCAVLAVATIEVIVC